MLSNTLRLNLCYLKIFHIFHSHYHPKIIVHTLKKYAKEYVYLYSCDYTSNQDENEEENEK